MPIEINELIVRARVSDSAEQAQQNQTSTQTNEQVTRQLQSMERLVEETLDLIKRKNER